MRLQLCDQSALHYPRQEWLWLRAATRLSAVGADSFIYGVELDGKIWAWHPNGAEAHFTGTIPVLILENVATEIEAHGLYLKTTFERTAGQDAEWSAAIRVAEKRFGQDFAKGLPPFWNEALRACGLEAHLGVLAHRAKFHFLTIEELQFLYDQRWDPMSFELFENLRLDVRQAFLKAIINLRLSATHVKECASHLILMIKKFGEPAALKVLANPYKSGEELRTGLMRTAQPELASLSDERIKQLRALKAPPRTSVFGDPSFEQDGIKITHSPRDISDFEEFKAWVERPDIQDKIKSLLEIYQ